MEEKKKGKGLVVALVLFILISLGLGGYIVYDKVLTKEEVKTESNEKKSDKKVEINKDSELVLKFDEDKVINHKDMDYKMYETLLSMQVSTEGENKATISFDKSKIYTDFGVENNANIKDSYDIEFDNEIADIFIGGIGQDSSGTFVFFLMEDGTVQYIEVYKALQNNDFSPKKANDVNNIIKFKNVSAATKEANTSGIVTVLAMKKDGTFYDMSKVINN